MGLYRVGLGGVYIHIHIYWNVSDVVYSVYIIQYEAYTYIVYSI